MVRVGVIGGGKWGKNHVRTFSGLDCELVGLADVNPERKALADEYGVKFFTDYKEMLPDVDAVSVVVPTDLHYGVVKECLLAKKHVIVEKPITLHGGEAKELMELAKKQGCTLMVGYLFRYNAVVKELKKRIKNIGDLQYITTRFIHSNKPPRKDMGVILNFGVHLIDTLNYILDDVPKKVYCKKLNYLSDEREDCAFITLDYGKIIANLEVSWFHPLKKRDMWVVGSNEKLYVDLLEQILERHPITVSYEGNVVGEKEIVEINKNEPLKEELKRFCEVAESGKNDFDEAGGEYSTTKICELCLESAKTGKEVEVILNE